MISRLDFRNGMVVNLDNELFEIVEFQHVKPGKGGAFTRTKFKNVLSGRTFEKTFRSEKMEEVRLEERVYQYLYHDGDLYHFMDKETYEQIAVNEDVVGDKNNWMKENEDISLMFHGSSVISISVPLHVVLLITKSDPGVQGDRSSGATKPATLETGVTVLVPLFLNEGENIKVDTRTGEYIERVN